MWGKGKMYALLVKVQSGTAAIKISAELPQKATHSISTI